MAEFNTFLCLSSTIIILSRVLSRFRLISGEVYFVDDGVYHCVNSLFHEGFVKW